MIRARDVSQAFGSEQVLENLSISVESGEILAVIGPSGVGKTTLLHVLALAREPDAGRLVVDGVDAWDADDPTRRGLRRRLGMVYQSPNLFDGSVARNVEYGLRVRRPWTERIRDELREIGRTREPPDAVREALSVVELVDSGDQSVDSLSGGEAQRVSFARALAFDPDVLLLDEPTSDLDPRNTAIIEDAALEASEQGVGVVLATHDMHQAERVADRVAVLLGNSITDVGTTDRIFDRPTDERTRQFIDGELVY